MLVNQSTIRFLIQTILNPLLWNIAARLEYKNKWLTRLTGGPYRGCYTIAATIFFAGIWRDFLYHEALMSQVNDHHLRNHPVLMYVGAALVLMGQILVLSSTYALGITGTFLGDYFGILMKERVTSFPFNVMSNPMYNGSTMIFLGTALWYQKLTGVYMSVFVWIVYRCALHFEEPFTARIYREAAIADQKPRGRSASIKRTPSRGRSTSKSSKATTEKKTRSSSRKRK